jgi:hypothetical protein
MRRSNAHLERLAQPAAESIDDEVMAAQTRIERNQISP